jgi:hypothetical protein
MGVRKVVAGLGAGLLCCLAAGVASASPAPQAAATVHTVVSGLDNPRDLAFDRNGRLYVAEAGHGGSRCFNGAEGQACLGFTSGISRVNVRHLRARRIVSGLVSSAAADGTGATGVDGIDTRRGKIFGIITEAPQEVPGHAFGPNFTARVKGQLGKLIKASTDGSWHSIGNVGHRDYIWTENHSNLVPGQFPDANPYGVTALRHGRYVVDAGSNTLDRIDRRGRVHILKFIPNPTTSDAVPTCIERGPDGALYIGQLTGAGNAPGSASVWRYSRRTDHLSIWATGLTAVTGCGFHHGHFYATEFSTQGLVNAAPGTGAVVRVPANSANPVTVASGLNFPGGFAARGHNLYVSNWSILPSNVNGGGQVLRIHLGS